MVKPYSIFVDDSSSVVHAIVASELVVEVDIEDIAGAVASITTVPFSENEALFPAMSVAFTLKYQVPSSSGSV